MIDSSEDSDSDYDSGGNGGSSDPFAFFHGRESTPNDEKPQTTEDRYADLLNISKSKRLLDLAVRANPDILWEDVRPEKKNRFCMCMMEDDLSRSLMQAAIDHKTITELMLRNIGREVPLKWKNICRIVPLSVLALEEYQDYIDWDTVSGSYRYPLTHQFIEKLGHKLNWSQIYSSNLEAISQQEFEKFVFETKKIPLTWACKTQPFEAPTNYSPLFLPEQLIEQYIDELVVAELLPSVLKRNFDMFDRLYQKCSNEKWFPQLAACDNLIPQIEKHSDRLERYLPLFKMSQTFKLKGWNPLIPFISEQQFRTLVLPENDKFSWVNVSFRKKMSESFLNDFADQLHWNVVSQYPKLSQESLRTFADRLDKKVIARCQYLPEDLITRFASELDWDDVSYYRKLSEALIEAHMDKINWGNISSNQELSKEFVQKHKNRLNFIKLKQNPYIKFDLSDL